MLLLVRSVFVGIIEQIIRVLLDGIGVTIALIIAVDDLCRNNRVHFLCGNAAREDIIGLAADSFCLSVRQRSVGLFFDINCLIGY